MPYEILIHELAAMELESLRVFEERRIVDEIDKQLSYQPTIAMRRKKCLTSLTPSFEHVPPVWELRVGEYRVFYDVDEPLKQVHVRAVRHKAPPETTEEIA